MTPDQARTKWCPFARVGLVITDKPEARPTVNAVNRYVATTAVGKLEHEGKANGTACFAGDCMAWRWHEKGTGYCGIAGLPNDFD